jgi:adenylate cyclase
MINEIERKFYVKEMPDIAGIAPRHYERFILRDSDGIEERISKINDKYVYERKKSLSDLERSREKREISAEEFAALKDSTSDVVVRDRYDISANPMISIQVYRGRYEGLVRAEVEFASIEEASSFEPLPWMGAEMTGLPISRDATLIRLTEEELASYLNR